MTSTMFRTPIALAILAASCGAAHAQLIDQFDVRREGDNLVLQLNFAEEIQFQRSVSTRSGDLTLIYYALVTGTNAEQRPSQGLRLGEKQGLPRTQVFDEADGGSRSRRIVLRLAQPAKLSVRAGKGNRSVEVVYLGAASAAAGLPRAQAPAAASAQATPATLPLADRRFLIVLQSSTDPNAVMSTRIPAELQDFDVFTRERMVDGAQRHELVLGHFATRTQAEAVLRQLSGFPQAAIVTAAPAPAPAAVAPAGGGAVPPVAVAPPAPVAPPAMPVPVPTPPPAPAPTTSSPTPSGAAAAAPSAQAAPVAQVPAAAAAVPSEVRVLAPAEVEARAGALFDAAQAAMRRQEPAAALPSLNALLDLPPNRYTRDAQEMAGVARARTGDVARARIEFETYLQLYPQGDGSDRVRRELASLPAAEPRPVVDLGKPRVETTTTGSASMYHFGGNGQVRSQDFKDSPVAGVPQVAGEPQFTSDKVRQIYNDVDVTWRQRDDERDMRFSFRDSYTTDLDRSDRSRNRLSSLFFDYKSIPGGYGARLGRQSPLGGGVLGRFDGISAHYVLRPKLKLGVVGGEPADKYFDSKRRFLGASIDAEALLPNFGTAVYVIQRNIDAEIDRRAVGLEMRYFKGGASVFSQFDYDTLIGGLNIATVQGTLIMDDLTVINGLYDRRALSVLALGNALTFEDPANPGVLYTRIADKLATTTLEALRDQIKRITPFVTQAQLGFTRPINKSWQVGGSGQLTETGPIPPVPGVVGFETGRPASGKIASLSGQLIGLNLYSPRDTHVLSSTVIYSHRLKGYLVSYNNSSTLANDWQFEPSLQYYRDSTTDNTTNERWTPGLRVTYRGWKRWALESSLTYELGKASRVAPDPIDPTLTTTTRESSTRVNYSLGARFEF